MRLFSADASERSSMSRVIWIVLDSVGAGDLPDCEEYGDKGCHTIGHVWQKNKGLNIPNMISLGLGNIDGMIGVPKKNNPVGCYGRCREISKGKDTTTGHWEMVGIYVEKPFPTYPQGFPGEITEEFIRQCNIPGILGNCTASGTKIIEELGEEHERTGKPIIYTSADSVFQIACNEAVYPPDKLYDMCIKARGILKGKHGVGRVIARPYIKTEKGRERTSNRRDFSLEPPDNNLLSCLKERGFTVAAVGKIEDIFAGKGITKAVHTKDNMDGMDKTLDYMKTVDSGLIFTNLVEFDSKWGHRNDYEGYGRGLNDADKRIGEIIDNMMSDDVLIINADHGCDPTVPGTDHTREYIPLLVYGRNIKKGINLGTRKTFGDIGQTVGEILGLNKNTLSVGQSFYNAIKI